MIQNVQGDFDPTSSPFSKKDWTWGMAGIGVDIPRSKNSLIVNTLPKSAVSTESFNNSNPPFGPGSFIQLQTKDGVVTGRVNAIGNAESLWVRQADRLFREDDLIDLRRTPNTNTTPSPVTTSSTSTTPAPNLCQIEKWWTSCDQNAQFVYLYYYYVSPNSPDTSLKIYWFSESFCNYFRSGGSMGAPQMTSEEAVNSGLVTNVVLYSDTNPRIGYKFSTGLIDTTGNITGFTPVTCTPFSTTTTTPSPCSAETYYFSCGTSSGIVLYSHSGLYYNTLGQCEALDPAGLTTGLFYNGSNPQELMEFNSGVKSGTGQFCPTTTTTPPPSTTTSTTTTPPPCNAETYYLGCDTGATSVTFYYHTWSTGNIYFRGSDECESNDPFGLVNGLFYDDSDPRERVQFINGSKTNTGIFCPTTTTSSTTTSSTTTSSTTTSTTTTSTTTTSSTTTTPPPGYAYNGVDCDGNLVTIYIGSPSFNILDPAFVDAGLTIDFNGYFIYGGTTYLYTSGVAAVSTCPTTTTTSTTTSSTTTTTTTTPPPTTTTTPPPTTTTTPPPTTTTTPPPTTTTTPPP